MFDVYLMYDENVENWNGLENGMDNFYCFDT